MIFDMLHCGEWIQDGWNYCPICGKKIEPLPEDEIIN